MNKVILMGRLTADPEMKQTQNGIPTCRFSVAINRPFTPKDGGERQADFINVVAWRQTAEFVARYFSKGKMILVEGTLRNNNWTDNNGVKHYTNDIIAENVSFCGDKNPNGGQQQGGNFNPNNSYGGGGNSYGGNNSGGNNNNYQSQNYNQAPPQQNYGQSSGSEASFGDMGGFEEILGDGDVPF